MPLADTAVPVAPETGNVRFTGYAAVGDDLVAFKAAIRPR
jgi:hypothetical protein